ncbi:MAG: hypothetical protein IPM23_00350 [Candidatus Melainabacteria bacterium]|nr:hypothetical protein [Candidatus Melainabacteria bacterium]
MQDWRFGAIVCSMNETLKVINEMEKAGVIGRYAIGGAIGVVFYSEVVNTFDLDIFCNIGEPGGLLVDMAPLYSYLMERGYVPEGANIKIEGVPVQFLVPPSDLEREAIEMAVEIKFLGVPTRVFTLEHLLAIMIKAGRPKDMSRIPVVLASTKPDPERLNDILTRFGLVDKWDSLNI